MSHRPLRSDEIDYLAQHQQVLGRAMQSRYITWTLLAIPVAFLLFVLGAGRSMGAGDLLATGLAVGILLALVGGVVFYGRGQVGQGRAFRDMRLLGDLKEDLLGQEARVEAYEVIGKQSVVTGRGDQARRELYLLTGLQRFRVGAARWMATAVGESPTFEFAPRSGFVLAVDGERERLPTRQSPDREDLEPRA